MYHFKRFLLYLLTATIPCIFGLFCWNFVLTADDNASLLPELTGLFIFLFVLILVATLIFILSTSDSRRSSRQLLLRHLFIQIILQLLFSLNFSRRSKVDFIGMLMLWGLIVIPTAISYAVVYRRMLKRERKSNTSDTIASIGQA